MSRPMFSVVVPTRDRADTLVFALETCLAQDYDDYEIVIFDNCGTAATRQVVERMNSSRVRYIRSNHRLFMSDSWDAAVLEAKGEYITLIGDDDGLMPYALAELSEIVRLNSQPPAIHWERGYYTWPTIAVASEANFLQVPVHRGIQHHNSRARILEVLRYELSADMLPMIYNSVIRRDVLEIHRDRVGRLFPATSPDIYSGFAFGYIAAGYISVSVPMHIAGLSGNSTGVAVIMGDGTSDVASEFKRLRDRSGIRPHPTTPDAIMWTGFCEDSFQIARDLLFPQDTELVVDRRRMIERHLASIPHTDPADRARIRASIRDSLVDRPDLQTWFDREAPDLAPSLPFRMKPKTLGFDGKVLSVDTTKFGVRDIHGAVRVAADILGYRGGEISYDLPSRS